MNKPVLLAIVGESGSGKNFIREYIQKIQTIIPIHTLLSWTTRPKRDYEEDGKDYIFCSENIFKKFIDLNDFFLEWNIFNGWYYGSVFSDLVNDKLNVAILDAKGVRQIIDNYSPEELELIVWYLEADGKVRLERGLARESNPDVDEIVRRYSVDKEDFDLFFTYLYQLRADVILNNKRTCLGITKTIHNNENHSFKVFEEINKALLTIKDKYGIL